MKVIAFKTAPTRPWTEHVAECEESVCGRYRITRSKGSNKFNAVYLPAAKDGKNIGICRGRDDAVRWATEHAAALPAQSLAA